MGRKTRMLEDMLFYQCSRQHDLQIGCWHFGPLLTAYEISLRSRVKHFRSQTVCKHGRTGLVTHTVLNDQEMVSWPSRAERGEGFDRTNGQFVIILVHCSLVVPPSPLTRCPYDGENHLSSAAITSNTSTILTASSLGLFAPMMAPDPSTDPHEGCIESDCL